MPEIYALASFALLGLVVGSFLNVVIHRIPRMMEMQWAAECAELNRDPNDPSAAPDGANTTYNLITPASSCPSCGHRLGWLDLIPVLGYVMRSGRCAHCNAPIGLRYPIVEIATAAVFSWVGLRHGFELSALAWCGFFSCLIALACIDWDTTLLPDHITVPLAWTGMGAASLGLTDVSLSQSLWGAVAGYLILWTVYWAFKLATGKEGIGYGDFKLLAALGAWLGLTALPTVLLVSALSGAIVGITLKVLSRMREGGYVPFGPFLALGATLWVVLEVRLFG